MTLDQMLDNYAAVLIRLVHAVAIEELRSAREAAIDIHKRIERERFDVKCPFPHCDKLATTHYATYEHNPVLRACGAHAEAKVHQATDRDITCPRCQCLIGCDG